MLVFKEKITTWFTESQSYKRIYPIKTDCDSISTPQILASTAGPALLPVLRVMMQCIPLLTDSSAHHSQHWRSSSLFWPPLRCFCFGKLLLSILDLKMSKIPHQLLICQTPCLGLVWHCLSQPSQLSQQVFSLLSTDVQYERGDVTGPLDC